MKRVFLFPESTLCNELIAYANDNDIGPNEWIFKGRVKKEGRVGQVSPTYVWYLLSSRFPGRKKGLATSLNIQKIKGGDLKPVWPHLFRHGAAMYMLHRTGRLDVVQKQLGHRSVMTTEIYAELTDDDRQRIIKENEEIT